MKALVISVRGFHAGYLGCYGNEWITTPALDRLAASGVVFDQHLADVPEAAAAPRAWRSGRYQFAPVNPAPDLLDELRLNGVRTVLVADGSRALPETFTQGWDQIEVVNSLGSEATFLEQTLETANATLRKLTNEQWLLWVDLATLLPPWNVPAEFSEPYFRDEEEQDESAEEDEEEEGEEEEELVEEESEPEEEEEEPLTPWIDPAPGRINTEDDIDLARLQSSYAAAVSFVDAAVDSLLEQLDRLGLSETFVVLTSDHGQALGEHGIVGPCRPWLHDELMHLPLLMRVPAALARGREVQGVRVGALTQSPDLMPTLLDAFGLTPPEGVQGKSLLPLARQETATVRDYACCGLQLGAASEWCLRTGEWALVLPGEQEPSDPPRGPQLFSKPDDRWEMNNVLQHHLERAEAFEQTLKEFVKAAAQPGALVPPPLRERVEAPA
jgi:arylsulfatase A-like enzyme